MKTYVVGGAVRDLFMGIEPKDMDYVVVGATREDMLSLGFSQVGADFPVFLHPETREEYALARTERKVGSGYHGFETNTTGVTLVDDLGRRDFTMNAMALDGDTIVDPFGGKNDIADKIIRHINAESFMEDPLRVIRGIRFAARYGFSIAPETEELFSRMIYTGMLSEINPNRVRIEILKGCSVNVGEFFRILCKFEAHKWLKFGQSFLVDYLDTWHNPIIFDESHHTLAQFLKFDRGTKHIPNIPTEIIQTSNMFRDFIDAKTPEDWATFIKRYDLHRDYIKFDVLSYWMYNLSHPMYDLFHRMVRAFGNVQFDQSLPIPDAVKKLQSSRIIAINQILE